MGADNSKDGYNRAPVDEWEGWGDDEDDSTITQQPQSEGFSSLFKFNGSKDGETEKNKAKKKRGGNDESGGVMATMKNQMTNDALNWRHHASCDAYSSKIHIL